jgi:hypothetical protein
VSNAAALNRARQRRWYHRHRCEPGFRPWHRSPYWSLSPIAAAQQEAQAAAILAYRRVIDDLADMLAAQQKDQQARTAMKSAGY